MAAKRGDGCWWRASTAVRGDGKTTATRRKVMVAAAGGGGGGGAGGTGWRR